MREISHFAPSQMKERDMSTNWTPNQLQAINKNGSNILVAAAARKWKDNSFSRENGK